MIDPIDLGPGELVAAETPDPAALTRAAGGGMAAAMQAGVDALKKDNVKEFRVPGWNGKLLLRARHIPDEDLDDADTTALTIFYATSALLLRNPETGKMEEINGGWSGARSLLALPATTEISDVMVKVLSSRRRMQAFVSKLLNWMDGDIADLEEKLGE